MPALVGAGAVAATIAVATVAVDGVDRVDRNQDTGPAAAPSDSSSERLDPSSMVGSATATYFIGDTPTGARLFREFQPIPTVAGESAVQQALQRLAVDEGPADPDYRTVWPAGSFADVRLEESRIVVELGTADALEAPVGITPEEQLLGVQQVVYTAEATVGETLPVSFEWQGAPATEVLGTEVGREVPRDLRDHVTSPVGISDPAEGTEVTDGAFVASGSMADTVTTDVRWMITDVGWADSGEESLVLTEGVAEPAEDPEPFAPGWRTEPIDVSDLGAGDYLFVAQVEETGQTSDSPAVFTDTRIFTVR